MIGVGIAPQTQITNCHRLNAARLHLFSDDNLNILIEVQADGAAQFLFLSPPG